MAAPEALAVLRGAGLGLAVAAPVGPIALLCIRRTLVEGRVAGLATGLGAAAADAVYGVVAALGLGVVTAALLTAQAPLRLAGAALLAWLGAGALRRAWRAAAGAAPTGQDGAAAGPAAPATGLSPVAACAGTFVLTLANPATILSFAAAVAALAGPAGGLGFGLLFVLGVFLGSMAWWIVLVSLVAALRRAVPARALAWIEAASGAALLGFAALALAAAAQGAP